MKTFTLKDFIHYNNPCFSCGNKISFIPLIGSSTSAIAARNFNIRDRYIEIELSMSYKKRLSIFIYPISNKVVVTNPILFQEYLKEHYIIFKSYCNKCFSTIHSEIVNFDLKNPQNSFILPFGISSETLQFFDNDTNYSLYSRYGDNKSHVRFHKTTNSSKIISFELNLIPLSKFKTKEAIITKINKYAIFL